MISLVKPSAQKAGLPPGTPVYTGEETETVVKINIIDYDKDHSSFLISDNVEECSIYKDTPTVSWINVNGLHQVELVEKLCR